MIPSYNSQIFTPSSLEAFKRVLSLSLIGKTFLKSLPLNSKLL